MNGRLPLPRGFGLALALALIAPSASSRAQILDRNLWGTNGSVTTMARSGNTLYIGGGFSTVGPCMGGGVPLDLRTGAPRRSFPRVAGAVNAVVSDGAGGWYIGGRFSAVEGEPRTNLAHVLRNGRVDGWSPELRGDPVFLRDPDADPREPGVDALVVQGNTLFVGGLFHTVDGRPRANLAAFDLSSGALRAWAPVADGEVRCLTARGETVFAGGEFTHVGPIARAHLVALHTRTGAVSGWDPAPSERVRTLALDGRTLFVGGDFDAIGGEIRNSIAALDLATGRALEWDAGLGPQRRYIAHGDWVWPFVSALSVHRGRLYVGGSFASFHGTVRYDVAALDASTGEVTGFDAQARGGAIRAIAAAGNTVYVAGALYWFGDQIRINVAALDATTGRATGWDPRADGIADAIAVDRSTVYLGGDFTSVHEWQPRNGLAALDLASGAVTGWNPRIDGYGVRQLAVRGNSVYLLGPIRSIDGEIRGGVGAVDAVTGAVLPWYPAGSLHWDHRTMVVTDRAVYAAGWFGLISGRPQSYLAELDPVTGAASAWDARLDGDAFELHALGDTLYLSGDFRNLAGQPRTRMGALDLATAAPLPWQPLPGRMIESFTVIPRIAAIAARGDRVYVGGSFTSMNGAPRTDLAALDIAGGALLPWQPEVGGEWPAMNMDHVVALAVHDSSVWVGGSFATIHGESLPYLAVVDATSGVPRDWAPRADGAVETMVTQGDTVYVGGSFRSLGGWPRASLAAFLVGAPRVASSGDHPRRFASAGTASLAPIRPNPVRTEAGVEFTLAAPATVELAVFDLQGRRMTTLLDHRPLDAGVHQVRLETAGWGAGVFFCRLEAAGRTVTRRLLVVR